MIDVSSYFEEEKNPKIKDISKKTPLLLRHERIIKKPKGVVR